MIKRGKKYKKSIVGIEQGFKYSTDEAMQKLKTSSYVKFNESVTANICLNIDPEKADQLVRGSLTLPHVFGKPVRIIAFAKGEMADKALKAGAEIVGAEDLVEKIINEQWTDFDYAVATPDLMGLVGKCAKILGPLGLLPNKKNNTVALDLSEIIKDLKSGLLFFKNDKHGQVNFTFGKMSLSETALKENFSTFISVLSSLRPSRIKGNFVKKITISSTMGPGIGVQSSI